MMDENAPLNGATTKNRDSKKMRGYTPLIVIAAFLLGLAFYSDQIHDTSLAGGGGTTRGGAITAASLMMSNDDDSLTACFKSEGTYDSQTDFCYTCGSKKEGTLGYCWNSQTPQCPPACDNVQGASGIGDNQCGDPCDKFKFFFTD